MSRNFISLTKTNGMAIYIDTAKIVCVAQMTSDTVNIILDSLDSAITVQGVAKDIITKLAKFS